MFTWEKPFVPRAASRSCVAERRSVVSLECSRRESGRMFSKRVSVRKQVCSLLYRRCRHVCCRLTGHWLVWERCDEGYSVLVASFFPSLVPPIVLKVEFRVACLQCRVMSPLLCYLVCVCFALVTHSLCPPVPVGFCPSFSRSYLCPLVLLGVFYFLPPLP